MPVEIPYLVLDLGPLIIYRGRTQVDREGFAFIPMDPESYANLADGADMYIMIERLFPDPKSVAGLDMYSHATPVWSADTYGGSHATYGESHATRGEQPNLTYVQIEHHYDVYLRDEGAGPNPLPLTQQDLRNWERETPIRFEVGPRTHSYLEMEPKKEFMASVNISGGSSDNLVFTWSLPYKSGMRTSSVDYVTLIKLFGPPPPLSRTFARSME